MGQFSKSMIYADDRQAEHSLSQEWKHIAVVRESQMKVCLPERTDLREMPLSPVGVDSSPMFQGQLAEEHPAENMSGCRLPIMDSCVVPNMEVCMPLPEVEACNLIPEAMVPRELPAMADCYQADTAMEIQH